MMAAKTREGSGIERVMAIAQPISSTESIQNRAYEVTESLSATFKSECECITVNQTELHATLSGMVDKAVGIEGGGFAKGQLRSYMRTPVGYYVAQLLSQNGTPCVVMGTGNYDEDGYLMYYCKAGDGVVDVQLIADLHKSEVFQAGQVDQVTVSLGLFLLLCVRALCVSSRFCSSINCAAAALSAAAFAVGCCCDGGILARYSVCQTATGLISHHLLTFGKAKPTKMNWACRTISWSSTLSTWD